MEGKGGFLKSLTILLSGSVIALVVQAGAQVVFARIFTPESLGVFAFLLAVPVSFVGVVGARYEAPLVYEEDESKIFALIKLNVLTTLLFSTVVSVINLLYFTFFKQEYCKYYWLIPAVWVYLIANGLTNMLNSYNNRYRSYGLISKMYVLRTLAQMLGSLVLGYVFVKLLKNDSEMLSVAILMIPYCVGMLFGLFTQGKTLTRHYKEIAHIPMSTVWMVAKLHFRQPVLSAPAVFVNSFSYSLMTVTVEGFDKACAGFYSLSTKLLGMPISLISANISKVYLESASIEYNSTRQFKKAFNKTLLFLVALAVPMFLCMYFLAPSVCSWLLGGDWIEAGEYIKILAMMFSFRFVSTAISAGFYACRKQQAELLIQGAFLLVTIMAGLYSTYNALSVHGYLTIVGAVRSAVMFIQIIIVFIYSRGVGCEKLVNKI